MSQWSKYDPGNNTELNNDLNMTQAIIQSWIMMMRRTDAGSITAYRTLSNRLVMHCMVIPPTPTPTAWSSPTPLPPPQPPSHNNRPAYYLQITSAGSQLCTCKTTTPDCRLTHRRVWICISMQGTTVPSKQCQSFVWMCVLRHSEFEAYAAVVAWCAK